MEKINELGPLAWHLVYPRTDRRGMGSVTIRDGRYVDWYKVGRAVQTNLPIPVTLHPKNLWYFEVTILLCTPTSRINIGLGPYNPLSRPLGAGWEENEVGYMNTGRKMVNGTSVVGEKYGKIYTQGHTIGCGFNRNGTVFFTHDHEIFPAATTLLSPLLAYYPVLSGSASTSLKLNLGQEPFLLAQANTENWGFMVDALPGYGESGEEVKGVGIEVREGVPRMSVVVDGPPEYQEQGGMEGNEDSEMSSMERELTIKSGSEDAIDHPLSDRSDGTIRDNTAVLPTTTDEPPKSSPAISTRPPHAPSPRTQPPRPLPSPTVAHVSPLSRSGGSNASSPSSQTRRLSNYYRTPRMRSSLTRQTNLSDLADNGNPWGEM